MLGELLLFLFFFFFWVKLRGNARKSGLYLFGSRRDSEGKWMLRNGAALSVPVSSICCSFFFFSYLFSLLPNGENFAVAYLWIHSSRNLQHLPVISISHLVVLCRFLPRWFSFNYLLDGLLLIAIFGIFISVSLSSKRKQVILLRFSNVDFG